MDTTYFGRGFGVMLFKDAYSGINLYKAFVKTETNQQYAQGIKYLRQQGFTILTIVRWAQRITTTVPGYSSSNV